MNNKQRKRGLATYEKLFGKKRKLKRNDRSLDQLTIDHLFANVWSRTGLEMRQRSMVTVALLATLGRDRELETHIKGALNLGITHEEILEIMIHVAHYAGWPAGHNGQRVAKRVFKGCNS